jgi:hypothetical protein
MQPVAPKCTKVGNEQPSKRPLKTAQTMSALARPIVGKAVTSRSEEVTRPQSRLLVQVVRDEVWDDAETGRATPNGSHAVRANLHSHVVSFSRN